MYGPIPWVEEDFSGWSGTEQAIFQLYLSDQQVYCPTLAGPMRSHGDHLIACEFVFFCIIGTFCPFSLFFNLIEYIPFHILDTQLS